MTAILWAIYALGTALPVLSYPSLLVPALIRAAFGLLIAWFFWFRPGGGIAILGTILGLASIPLAFLAVTNASAMGPLYLFVAAVALLGFIASA